MKKDFNLIITVVLVAFSFVSGAVTKKAFDFVVGVNGDFKAARAAAEASTGSRFYIFFQNGEYNIGSLTGDTNQMTTFTAANVSFIGQSSDKTIIYNKSTNESISTTATLNFKNSHNLYMQDLTIQNRATTTGRHVALCEESNNVVYKNVKLLSTQDTYNTKSTKTYWEDSEIHGTTDFICGRGDVFFNNCLIWTDKVSSITAPDGNNTAYGYVFSNCTIDGTVTGFTLGRPWKQGAKCIYINTIMKKLPTDSGWGTPINTDITTLLFAEYNSKKADGSAIDLSKRKKTYTKDGKTTATCNPVLTEAEAAKYNVNEIFGSWKPNLLTVQIKAPVASKSGSTLKWDDNANALCWVVFKDDKYFKCVTTPSCEMASGSGIYTVRAANEMGGLGAASNAVNSDGTSIEESSIAAKNISFSLNKNVSGENRATITIPSYLKGAALNVISGNGRVVYSTSLYKVRNEMRLNNLAPGTYIFEITSRNAHKQKQIEKYVQRIQLL